jgi:hypothetical protein
VVGDVPIQESKMDFEEQADCGDIVFVLNTYLNLPDVEVKPSIDEVQNMLNTAGKIIISVTRGVGQWRQIKKKTGKVRITDTHTLPDIIPQQYRFLASSPTVRAIRRKLSITR